MKKIMLKALKNISPLSLGIAVLSSNTTSMWFVYQPEEPKALEKLKKLK